MTVSCHGTECSVPLRGTIPVRRVRSNKERTRNVCDQRTAVSKEKARSRREGSRTREVRLGMFDVMILMPRRSQSQYRWIGTQIRTRFICSYLHPRDPQVLLCTCNLYLLPTCLENCRCLGNHTEYTILYTHIASQEGIEPACTSLRPAKLLLTLDRSFPRGNPLRLNSRTTGSELDYRPPPKKKQKKDLHF
jgi:hypothetical protein